MDDAETYKKVLADIVLSAVLAPGLPGQEYVATQALDQARFILEGDDISQAAERARSKSK
jgi:hypothetical protein